MSTNNIVPLSQYNAEGLSKNHADKVSEVGQYTGKIGEIAVVADYEIAKIAGHAVVTMAQLTQAVNALNKQLTDSGNQDDINNDFQEKILHVSGHNLITLTNVAQKEISQVAVQAMR